MANSLLDFVMSLVRDPDAAARYAADPDRAIAEANLTGVTSADVANLIPVVTESMPMGGSAGVGPFGGADPGTEAAGNVWASGAATAAFDAFAAPLPEPTVPEPVIGDGTWSAPVIDAGVIDAGDPGQGGAASTVPVDENLSPQLDPVIDSADEHAGQHVDAEALDDWTGIVSDPSGSGSSADQEPFDPGPNLDFFN